MSVSLENEVICCGGENKTLTIKKLDESGGCWLKHPTKQGTVEEKFESRMICSDTKG